ncbi:MAG: OmpH family outer membrane protein [Schleiferiaceae bacterium]|jgi:outer membrane protein
MKKIALIAAFAVATAASAQSVVAHVNVDSLLIQMPEYKQAQEALQAEQAKFEAEAREMNAELEKGAQALQANAGTWTELRQRQEQTRLQEMYNNIQEYMQGAQGQLQQKEVELITPVLEKLQNAIDAVAVAKNVSYVLDASQSKGQVIFSKGGMNLGPDVRAYLAK